MLAIVAAAQAEGTWERLKSCPATDCRWAFYDKSRNRSAVWCNMAVCGNRAKVRSYRERPPPSAERRERCSGTAWAKLKLVLAGGASATTITKTGPARRRRVASSGRERRLRRLPARARTPPDIGPEACGYVAIVDDDGETHRHDQRHAACRGRTTDGLPTGP